MPLPSIKLNAKSSLPADAGASLAGRVWLPSADGPSVVKVAGGELQDISAVFPTMRDLCETADPAKVLREAKGPAVGTVDAVLANTPPDGRDKSKPWLLTPVDLQALKAAGVTFAISMLERVIEERARGNPDAAASIRTSIQGLIGDDLSKLKPGSPEAMKLKALLIEKGMWSQYLEVGIGPDAEIFTKSQIMSAVGTGFDAGLHPDLQMEQSGAGGGGRGVVGGTHRRRDLGQRRESAGCRGPLGAAAGQGEGQQCELRHRPVHPFLRRRVSRSTMCARSR